MNQTEFQFDRSSRARFERWKTFHKRNPRVFGLFVRFAGEALARGKRIGARAIGERIRWEVYIRTDRGSDGFKINDHHWPFYARLLSLTDPRFSEFFVFKIRSDAPSDREIVNGDDWSPQPR